MITMFDELRDQLPPIISRDRVEDLLGGVISAKTLANLDSLGKGPKGRMRSGGKIVYGRDNLLEWLDNRTKILN
jgi:hypothetical protein